MENNPDKSKTALDIIHHGAVFATCAVAIYLAVDFLSFKEIRYLRDLELTRIITTLVAEMKVLENSIQDRYTGRQANRYARTAGKRFEILESRVLSVEKNTR